MPDDTEALLRGSLAIVKLRELQAQARTRLKHVELYDAVYATEATARRVSEHRWFADQLDAILKAVEESTDATG